MDITESRRRLVALLWQTPTALCGDADERAVRVLAVCRLIDATRVGSDAWCELLAAHLEVALAEAVAPVQFVRMMAT